MTASLRMFRIEFRRNLGLWLFPIMVGLTMWLAMDEGLAVQAPLWPRISEDIQFSVVLLGPLLGGIAAWMATRNRRTRMEELLSTTPQPAMRRDLIAFWATFAWGGLAYVLGGILVITVLAFRNPWDSLHLPTLLVGLGIVVSQAAAGYAAGYYFPSQFTAPLATVILWFSYILPRQVDARFADLSPADWGTGYNVFRGLSPDPGIWQAIWVLGLGGMALAAVVLKHQRAPVVWVSLLTAVMVAALGGTMLVQFDNRSLRERRDVAVIPYDPVCSETEQRFPVCVHPAYQRILPEVTEVMGKITGPLAGVPGAPTRAEQSSDIDFTRTFLPDGTFLFTTYGSTSNSASQNRGILARNTARTLVYDPAAMPVDTNSPPEMTGAQHVVGDWLMAQAGFVLREVVYRHPDGWTASTGPGMSSGPEETAALERFTALDPGVRHAWLEEHYLALRAGQVTLEDLP